MNRKAFLLPAMAVVSLLPAACGAGCRAPETWTGGIVTDRTGADTGVATRREETGTVVRAFFVNTRYDPQAMTGEVFPVERKIAPGIDPPGAAIEALLAGPTAEEGALGYLTSIPADAGLLSLSVENGTARADFDWRLEFQVGGSTRVRYIRAQLNRTLLQFPEIERVIISIEGRTEDILQP